MNRKLILVSGPSGSGKYTLISYLKRIDPSIVFPVSCTTRLPRPGEKEGEVYYFLTPEEFTKKINKEEFLEWASFGGNKYGTLKSEVLSKLQEGKTIVREVDVQGAIQIKKVISKENLAIIFIDAGSWETLRTRIEARAPMTPEELQKRYERYVEEMKFMSQADVIISNTDGNVEQAKEEFVAAVHRLSK